MCRQASLLKDPTGLERPCYSPFPRPRVRAEECTVRAQADDRTMRFCASLDPEGNVA